MSIIPYLYDMERPFYNTMERDFFRSPFGIVPRRAFHQFEDDWENMQRSLYGLVRPMDQLTRAMTQMALNEVDTKISSDDEKFQVNVDVQHFAPQEINVKVVDGHLVVEGKHEEKRDEHGYISRQFVRRYVLPQGCLPDTVQSTLSSDGVLTVTAPKVLPMPSIGERIVPITPTGPVKKQLGSPEIEAPKDD